MTSKEVIKFLESYKKNKDLEQIQLDSIEEMELNATTAKGISFGERTQGGKSTLPDYVYSQIIDMKEDLIRSIYSNTIRLKYINTYISKISDKVNNNRYSNIIYYKYIKNYDYARIERELNYSFNSVKKYYNEALIILADIMKDVELNMLERIIKNESYISREELDKFYKNYYLHAKKS